ncbi:UDP-glycosyltransferase [Morus notabilis]|uniref:UDP-glycosyltransferase n=1 Tax=Morus notabilis TaxID=981085 RepID=W9QDJ6_9ROSA|nr:UDP-glycosyltransferase [Morus notabilis]
MEGPFADFLERNFGKPVLLAGPVIPEPPMSSFSLEEKWDKFLGQFKAGSVIYCAFGSENILKKGQFQELLLGFELSGLPFFAVLKPPFGTETVEEALPDGFAGRVVGRGVVHSGWIQQQLILEHPSVGCYVTRCGSGSLREKVCKAIKTVMEENYSESSYVDDLSQKLQLLPPVRSIYFQILAREWQLRLLLNEIELFLDIPARTLVIDEFSSHYLSVSNPRSSIAKNHKVSPGTVKKLFINDIQNFNSESYDDAPQF